MDEETFFGIAKQRCCMLDAPTSLEELLAFVAEHDAHLHGMLLAPVFYHVGVVMYVDNDIVES